jgi:hypothetical protein
LDHHDDKTSRVFFMPWREAALSPLPRNRILIFWAWGYFAICILDGDQGGNTEKPVADKRPLIIWLWVL